MKISTKGRYAVRLMYDLAMHHRRLDRIKRHIKKTGDICKIFGTDCKTVKYQGIFKEFART